MSLWQTQSWQDMLVSSGQSEEYFIIELDVASSSLDECKIEMFRGGNKVFVEKRRVSLGEYGLFVIGLDAASFLPLGENCMRADGRENCMGLEQLINHLKELCAEENCLFFQIETLDYQNQKLAPVVEMAKDFGITQNFYKKFIPPYTAVIDLTQSEEEILTAMKPKGRYNIRLAEKKGVQVREVEKNDENIEIFHRLMQETTSRDNFSGNTLRYYQNFLEQENTLLLFAEHEGDVLAAGIFIYDSEVMYYYYGASSSHKRNLMTPYLLQWNAVQKAKDFGCSIYDFLGIAGPNETQSSLAGVTDFKLKLTPDTREVSRSLIYIHNVWKYRVIQLLKYFKK